MRKFLSRIVGTSQESNLRPLQPLVDKINELESGAIIIAGSGMCSGGRIKQHFKHNIWRSDCHVIISGFQARGTLGRALVDGAKRIKLWGETVNVEAGIHTIGGLSAHADQSALISWYKNFTSSPPLVLVHGEDQAQEVLAEKIKSKTTAEVTIAKRGQKLDMLKL